MSPVQRATLKLHHAGISLLLFTLLACPIIVTAQEAPVESAPDGVSTKTSYIPLRIKVVVKNGSSFRKMLSAYDNICKRHLLISKRFQAWGSEKVDACTNNKGLANITVDRLGLGKKHFRQIKRMAVIQY